MSSFFDVSQQLVVLLSLAVSNGGETKDIPAGATVRPPSIERKAEGPYQFSEQSWLAALKSDAGGDELASDAKRIFRTTNGRYYVPSETVRVQVLALRGDPAIAGLVAFNLARRHAANLQTQLKRQPDIAELYLAHALGVATSLRLLSCSKNEPNSDTTAAVPEISEIMPELLFHKGRPSKCGEIVERLRLQVLRSVGLISREQARSTGTRAGVWITQVKFAP